MDDSLLRWIKFFFIAGVLVALFLILSSIGIVVKILIVSALLAYIIDPLAVKLESRGLERSTATFIIFSVLSAVLTTLSLLLPVLSDQLASIQASFTPEQSSAIIGRLDQVISRKLAFFGIQNLDLDGRMQRGVAEIREWTFSHLLDVVGLLTHLVLIPFIVFFMLKDGRAMKKQMIRMIPNRYFEFSLNLIWKMDLQLGNYLRGQFLDALIFGVLAIVTLWFLGVKYFLIIGVFAGLANLIPFLGPVAGAAPAILVAVMDTGSFTLAGYVILAFIVMKLIDDSLIQPVVVARSVHMSPLLVLLAVIIGGKFFGILGMLLSVPVTGFVKVAATEGLESFRRYRLI